MQRRKEEARPTYHSRRATDLMIDAYHNTSLMSALRGLYAGCIVCSAALLALLILGPVMLP